MFRPLAMQHVALWLVREDAPAAALALAESGAFNPESAEGFRYELPDQSEQHYRDTYLSARSRLDRIIEHCGQRPEIVLPENAQPVSMEDLARLDQELAGIWASCFESQERVRRLEEGRDYVRQLLATLDTFADLDVDLGMLLSEHRFLDVRLGTVPSQNLPRLREALTLAGFVIDVFGTSAETSHCVVVGPAAKPTQTTSLLATAGWRGIEVPPELRTHPEQARADLEKRLAEVDEQLATQRELREQSWRSCWPGIPGAETTLALAAPYADMVENAMRGRGGLVLITGWVPKRDAAKLREALGQHVKRPYVLKLRNPESGERAQVPSVVRQPALLRSFATLVHTYGVPRYGEIDPTTLFAFSFVLMFGMMFGDVGQGAVLVVAGLLLRGAFARARVLVVSAGLASVLFGFAYGSVFGNEHLIQPIWMSPLRDPLRMLAVAVYWGIGFIVVASLVRVHNLYFEHGARAALLDSGGVAGMVLYLGAVAGLIGLVTTGEFGVVPALTMAGGALAMFVHAYLEEHGPVAERALVALIETFEALLGYFANTLSFMRVGAFSLNHVALALAVYTVADMIGGAGHWVALVVGNVFIMVLEGAIVAIQALRLEYYEGFSRFFSGDGREFHPLLLRQGKSHHGAKGA